MIYEKKHMNNHSPEAYDKYLTYELKIKIKKVKIFENTSVKIPKYGRQKQKKKQQNAREFYDDFI